MFDTRNDLPPAVRTKVVKLLNERPADAIDLGTQAKFAPWNNLFTGLAREADKYPWFLEPHLHGRG